MLSIDSNFNAKMVHKTEYNIHWMTPIVMDGYLYGAGQL